MDLTVRILNDLGDVEPGAWDALDHGPSPFVEHGFLRAAQQTGSVGGESGWEPYYVVAERGRANGAGPELVGAVPCFLKRHSYGEYIFDWGWARAASRAGIPYYPKLVVAAPMTPAAGRRILLSRGEDVDTEVVASALIERVGELADELECSSVHWLFCSQSEHALLAEHGFLPRASFQFHWHNRPYESFDEFLACMSSRRRKTIRKERRKALQSVDGIEFIRGGDLESAELEALDRFYRRTVRQHGGRDYLRPGFFEALSRLAPDRMVFAAARQHGSVVAGALYLETDEALYGRYWGCDEDIPFLHFETAYYAGIQRCIDRGTGLFEAGAQGEHKLLRGFAPSPTYSNHWIRHPDLRGAVRRFLREEAVAIEPYMQQLDGFTPYKQGS